jgi:hypothetical protein
MELNLVPDSLQVPSPGRVASVVSGRPRLPFALASSSHRCPRCKMTRPLPHYRPNYASFASNQISARCKTCRQGLNAALRAEARETGLCEWLNCNEPKTKALQCSAH